MKFRQPWAVFALMIVLVFTACKKEDDDNNNNNNNNNPNPTPTDVIPSHFKKIGEVYILGAGAKAVVYSDKVLFTGYNKLFVAMYDSTTNSRLKEGHFGLTTLMDMGTMQHASPVEVEDTESPADKFWKAAVVFTMPSMGGSWFLNLHFHNHVNDKEGDGKLAITVVNPATSVMKSFVAAADDSTKLYITMVRPTTPVIGLNDFEITLHKMENMMSYPAVSDYTIEIEPEMPSMGHGSPNNVNPTHIAMGHYIGKVNFTMTGLWRVHLKLKKNGVLIDDKQFFDIEF